MANDAEGVAWFVGWKNGHTILLDNRGVARDSFAHQLHRVELLGELILLKSDVSTTTFRNFKTGKTFSLNCTNPVSFGPECCYCTRDNRFQGALVFNTSGAITGQFKQVGIESGQQMSDGTYTPSPVRVVVQDGASEKTGWMDYKGTWIREPGYSVSGLDGFGHFITLDSAGMMGLLDMQSDTVLPCRYRHIKTLAADRFLVVDRNGGQYIINRAGTLSTSFPRNFTMKRSGMIGDRLYLILQEYGSKKVGMYDDLMNVIIKPDFESIFLPVQDAVSPFIKVQVQGWQGLLAWPVVAK